MDGRLVSLHQLARVSGGTESLRQRTARLDIAEFGPDKTHLTVSGEQVRFRLLLAGFDPTDFRLEGAKDTLVARG